MIKLSTLICAIVLFSLISTKAQVNLQLGLIANYPLDNSPLDATSNHLDLTIQGSPTGTTDRFGTSNGAYNLNAGNPDYFTSAIDPLLAPTEVTVSAWVNLPNAVPDQKIAGRAVVGGGYLMGVDSNKLDAEIWDMSSTVVHYRLKASGVSNNAWTHLVMSYKANEYLRLYINGTRVDSMAAGATGVGTTAIWPFTVGGAPWQPAALNATGKIDDIYVYNRAINEDEVFALYSMVTSTFNGEPTLNMTSVYPVPVHDGNVTVEFRNNLTGPVHVKVADALGREVYTTDFMNPKAERLNVSNLSKGLYSVSFVNGNRMESHKLMIQ